MTKIALEVCDLFSVSARAVSTEAKASPDAIQAASHAFDGVGVIEISHAMLKMHQSLWRVAGHNVGCGMPAS